MYAKGKSSTVPSDAQAREKLVFSIICNVWDFYKYIFSLPRIFIF